VGGIVNPIQEFEAKKKRSVNRTKKYFINSASEKYSLGVNLAPRGVISPLGGMFTPLLTRRGEHTLLFRRMEGRTENFTPRE
jgi:hypothetical protein